jgi:hypothetical protein
MNRKDFISLNRIEIRKSLQKMSSKWQKLSMEKIQRSLLTEKYQNKEIIVQDMFKKAKK